MFLNINPLLLVSTAEPQQDIPKRYFSFPYCTNKCAHLRQCIPIKNIMTYDYKTC